VKDGTGNPLSGGNRAVVFVSLLELCAPCPGVTLPCSAPPLRFLIPPSGYLYIVYLFLVEFLGWLSLALAVALSAAWPVCTWPAWHQFTGGERAGWRSSPPRFSSARLSSFWRSAGDFSVGGRDYRVAEWLLGLGVPLDVGNDERFGKSVVDIAARRGFVELRALLLGVPLRPRRHRADPSCVG
jgi:hypothetical protein